MKCNPAIFIISVLAGYFVFVWAVLRIQANKVSQLTRHENGNRHCCANGELHKYGILGGIFEGTVCLKCGFYDWTRNY